MDVFQVVKALRIQKPGSVLTVVGLYVAIWVTSKLQTISCAFICLFPVCLQVNLLPHLNRGYNIPLSMPLLMVATISCVMEEYNGRVLAVEMLY